MKMFVILCILLTALSSYAATGKTISGTVTDLNGKPLANVIVVIENKVTHQRITVQTGEDGRFIVRNLRGKDYSVTVVPDITAPAPGVRVQLDGTEAVHKRSGAKRRK